MTSIFKVKIGLSPWTHGWYIRIYRRTILQINSQFRPENPNDKIWYRNRKMYHIILFQINAKLSPSLRKNGNLGFRKSTLRVIQNIHSPNRFYLTFPHDDSSNFDQILNVIKEIIFTRNFSKQFSKINNFMKKKLYCIQSLWCIAKVDKGNGSEMTLVVWAIKINLKNLKTYLWLDEMMQATIWRHQLYSAGIF